MASTTAGQTGSDQKSLQASLRKVYGSGELRRDVFGRRPALPSEIAAILAASGIDDELHESALLPHPPTRKVKKPSKASRRSRRG